MTPVPNRIIREAILSSEKMAMLAWPEEVFYRRVMSIVDDYGRFEANPQLLRARCYPLQTDAVRAADISRWMAACQKAGLILCYEVSGKCYLEVLNFQQQQRSASKYPPPISPEIICYQEQADAHLGVSVSVSVSEDVNTHAAKPRAPKFNSVEALKYHGVDESLAAEWIAFRKAKRAPVSQSVVDRFHAEAAKARLTMTEALKTAMARGWTGFEADWVAAPNRFGAPREDIARITVPGSTEEDPALRKIRDDEAKAVPMPDAIRALLMRKAA